MDFINNYYFEIGFVLGFIAMVYCFIKKDLYPILFIAIVVPFWGITLLASIIPLTIIFLQYCFNKFLDYKCRP
jgi:hypothetical protein